MDIPFLYFGKTDFDAITGVPVVVLFAVGVNFPYTLDMCTRFGKEEFKKRDVLTGASIEELELVERPHWNGVVISRVRFRLSRALQVGILVCKGFGGCLRE